MAVLNCAWVLDELGASESRPRSLSRTRATKAFVSLDRDCCGAFWSGAGYLWYARYSLASLTLWKAASAANLSSSLLMLFMCWHLCLCVKLGVPWSYSCWFLRMLTRLVSLFNRCVFFSFPSSLNRPSSTIPHLFEPAFSSSHSPPAVRQSHQRKPSL